MALRIDREWTLALIQFLKSLPDETAIAGRSLAEARGALRLTYSIERNRLGGRVGEPGGPGGKPALTLEHGQIRAECGCAGPHPCPHVPALAVTVLGEAFRRGSAYRREIKPLLPHAWRLGAILLLPTLFKPIDSFFELDKPRLASPDPPVPAKPPTPALANSRTPSPATVAPPAGRAKTVGPPLQVVMSLTHRPGSPLPMPVWRLVLLTGNGLARLCTRSTIKQLGRELKNKHGDKWQAALSLVEWLLEVSGMHLLPWLPDAERITTFEVRNLTRWLISLEGLGLLRWEDGPKVRLGRDALAPALMAGAEGRPVWALAACNGDGSPGRSGSSAPLAETALFNDVAQPGIIFAVLAGAVHRVVLGELQTEELLALRDAGEARQSLISDPVRGSRLLARVADQWTRREGAGFQNPWVESVSARPVVELRHKRGSWIWLAVYARSGAGHVFMREDLGRWLAVIDPAQAARWTARSPFEDSDPLEPLGESTNDMPEATTAPAHGGTAGISPAEPLVVLPCPGALEPIDAWLSRLVPFEALPQPLDAGRITYQWPSSEAAIAALRREWARRPAAADYYGNDAFQRLIDRRRRPPLRVEAESGGVDWLWISAEMEAELAGLTADAVARLLGETRDRLIRLPDGRAYQREGLEELLEELRALEDLGIRPGDGRRRLHALQLSGNLVRRTLGGQTLAALQDNLRGLAERFEGIPTAPIDEALAGRLRPYQRAGANFLVWAGQALGGALLADDMGLGKTVETLAALTALRRPADETRPSLVVCPASVAHNWRREAERFCPGLRVLVLEAGAGRARHLLRLGEWDLVVVNYALARRDTAALARVEWLMVCVDEAQAIKNPRSDIAAAVRVLPARHRFALTGTPVENRLADLVSIMDFAVPGHLGGLREEALNGALDAPGAARCLRARLRPVLLRRLKGEVAPELPERIEERIDCAMGDGQRRLYLAEVARARQALRGWSTAEGRQRMHVFAALTRLRQLCCEPALLGHHEAGSAKVDELLDLLATLLDEGHKTLVFSSFATMLDLLEGRLAALGAPVYKLTGQTPTAQRQELVEDFEKDTRPAIFLISLKAGGTGLNLVSASHVVIFDPWWNPAAEAQAIDRTHRIGQDKTVVALRLVTEGTIEERILELQERKRELIQAVLGEDGFGAALTREDIEFLLGGD